MNQFSKEPMMLETKIWAVSALIAPGPSLGSKNKALDGYVLTHEYTHLFLFLYLFFSVCVSFKT